jgi:putative solute:sodium symporter small subunit
MVLWFIFAFAVHWFATPLNEMRFLGFPLGYYMAAQGSLAAFVILIFVHNWLQDKIDDEFGVGDE